MNLGAGGFGRAGRGLVSRENKRQEGVLVNIFFTFVRIDSRREGTGALRFTAGIALGRFRGPEERKGRSIQCVIMGIL